MKFDYSRNGLSITEQWLERCLEAVPGTVSWAILLGMTSLSFLSPVTAAIFIIVFDFYWLLRMFYMTLFLLLSYWRLSAEEKTNWLSRIRALDRFAQGGNGNPQGGSTKGRLNFKQKVSLWIYRRELKRLSRSQSLPPQSKDILHLIIVPVSGESEDILEPGIRSFKDGSFPSSRLLIVLAVEEWAHENVKKRAGDLKEKYRSEFFDFLVTVHPSYLPGEARVKGANITFAAKTAANYLEKRRIPFENVIASCFDADTVASPHYFSCLTYNFMMCPERHRASFQPIPVYHNNIWDAPVFARVLEMGASFFLLAEATDPEKLVTFSSHSMSFKALVDAGYWPVDMVSDDSAIFWKAYIHFDGDYRVIPMYVTLSMDAATAESLSGTVKNVYKQKRRWAWGVENFPIVMRAFLRNKRISPYDKLRHSIKLFETHIAWATWPFLLAVIGWLPALFASGEFSSSVLYYSTTRITGTIFNLASLSLVATILLSIRFLPHPRKRFSLLRKILHPFEWLLIPFIAIFFSALPALDAQTRLMRGKYLEFWLTEKKRRPVSGESRPKARRAFLPSHKHR